MPTVRKQQTVAELVEVLRRSRATVQTEYRGLTTAELTALRRELRKSMVDFHVVKNTLGRIAAREAGVPALAERLAGPTALVAGGDDELAPVRAIDAYLRANPRTVLKVVGGVVDGRPLTAEQVAVLASLPGREVLVARLMGGLNAPIQGVVGVLGGPLRGLMGVLEARQRQLEGG